MSPQRENETQEMYMYRLEMTQERHEDELDRMSSRVDSVETMAVEARQIAMETNSMVELMPQRVIEAIDAKNKAKRLDLRDWIVVIVGLAGTITGIVIGVVK